MNMHHRTALLGVIALGFTAILPVCAQALDQPPSRLAQAAAPDALGDGRQQARDQATTLSVKAALMIDSELKTQTILVDTVNGSVRLTGQVTSAANFDRAKVIVGRVDGVKSVDNQLVLKEVRPQ